MWYRTGTVTVTTGSAVVTGAGTNFVDNVSVGEIFVGPDLRVYEIIQVVSATDLRIAPVYQAGTAGGQGYAIAPTQSFARDLALSAAALLNTFAAVRDGVGQGLFPDGTIATPGIRYSADQDTGLARYGPNLMSAVTGGVERMRFGDSNSSIAPLYANDGMDAQKGGPPGSVVVPLSVFGNLGGAATMRIRFGSAANPYAGHSFVEAQTLTDAASDLRFGTSGAERARFDSTGNFILGATQANNHAICRNAPQGTFICSFFSTALNTVSGLFVAVSNANYNPAGSALFLGSNTATGRSLSAAGTGNFSGSDYAEYMVKSAGCGLIAKGDVCGVDRDGRLTRTWADAVSFVIKSTEPSLVGGDIWAAEVGHPPEEPGHEPLKPTPPQPPAEDADDATVVAWREAVAAYPAEVASYQAAHAEWQKATDAYAKALPVWEAAHEKARQCVDRIAFCGQVPANVSGDFEVGDYIIAAASGAGIKAVAVKADDMTLAQYMRRIGKVWAIRDGRAWIDVQHG